MYSYSNLFELSSRNAFSLQYEEIPLARMNATSRPPAAPHMTLTRARALFFSMYGYNIYIKVSTARYSICSCTGLSCSCITFISLSTLPHLAHMRIHQMTFHKVPMIPSELHTLTYASIFIRHVYLISTRSPEEPHPQ